MDHRVIPSVIGIEAADRVLDKHSEDIEAAIETVMGMVFDKELEGVPASLSQYGKPYETVGVACPIDGRDWKSVAIDLAEGVRQWLAKYPNDRVIVWRVRPSISTAMLNDKPVIVIRFRAHTLGEIPECLP
jgi:hypothetical protein